MLKSPGKIVGVYHKIPITTPGLFLFKMLFWCAYFPDGGGGKGACATSSAFPKGRPPGREWSKLRNCPQGWGNVESKNPWSRFLSQKKFLLYERGGARDSFDSGDLMTVVWWRLCDKIKKFLYLSNLVSCMNMWLAPGVVPGQTRGMLGITRGWTGIFAPGR